MHSSHTQDAATYTALEHRSYNEAVEQIVINLGAEEAVGVGTPASSRKHITGGTAASRPSTSAGDSVPAQRMEQARVRHWRN